MRFFTWLLLWLVRLLAFGPRWLVRAASHLLGEISFVLGRHRRHVALVNLGICFPHLPAREREQLARRHFHFYARAFIERFEIWFGSPARLRKRVAILGMEHYTAHEPGPIIILAPHFLGLDAGGVRFQIERQFVSFYAHQSNAELDRWTLKGRRRFNDPVLVSKRQGLLTAVRWLKRGRPFYFLPDMDLGLRESVFVEFFGEPAATVTSVVRLARALGAAVVPMVTRMTDTGYEARFYPGWHHPDDDAIETIEQGARKMNAFIEARVREMPEQYLWTHRRFKNRPAGMPSVYD